MRTQVVRRLIAVAASAVLVMGIASGCSGSSSDGEDSSEKPANKAPGAESAADGSEDNDGRGGAQALSDGELSKVALTTADVKDFKVQKPPTEALQSETRPKADKSECQPIAGMIGDGQDPAPTGTVYRQLTTTDSKKLGLALFERLSGYSQKDAEKTMADLHAAVEKCTGGFNTSEKSDSSTYSAVKAVTAPKAGDDIVAYELTGKLKGDQMPLLFTVVRQGSSVASFYSMNPFEPAKAEIPASVVTAQAEKLK
ncbi:hypothetical protein ABZW18_24685 [Streptomyces sp. NPDC004647]|uniref:hypothetical protein n=1 Tax=Streptomyces sp. NPDC004647 TaxID=3154671 RepID=UPI0033B65B08